ncbi:zinc ABC transporter substrate-binding protein, partial [bacterium]
MIKIANKGQLLIHSIVLLLLIISIPTFAISSDKLTIYTVNYPLKYFAERIGGEHVDVSFPTPDGVDPAYWIPERKTIAEYQKADLILLNGAHYAQWTEKATLPRSKVIDTSREFKGQYIRLKKAVTHSHGPGGEHAHEDVAFTIWLDFSFAVQQAKAIEKAFSRKRPGLYNTFQKNYKALENDLMELDRKIKGIVSKNPSLPLVLSHPVYDYLTRRYRLNARSVHWEPDEIPGDALWLELRSILKNHPAQWMIWEGKPLDKSVEMLKSTGAKSTVFNPCGNTPVQGDFLTVMNQNI